MIRFYKYKVVKMLRTYYPIEGQDLSLYGGFEIFTDSSSNNRITILRYIKLKDKYLENPKKMTYEEATKTCQHSGLTFLWFTRKSDLNRFMKNNKNCFYDMETIKKLLKQRKIFNFSGSKPVNLILEFS